MRTIIDPQCVLTEGLEAIWTQFQLPTAFPPAAQAEAEAAARRTPDRHTDRTSIPFVTLDPAASRDLDQALAIEAAGSDLLLHYAIADVGWFVPGDGAMDAEAWVRGTSQYLPDGKVSLYPTALSEGAASLLPDGDRPAAIFTVRLDPAGLAKLDGAERALVRSRAKLAYETATEADLPAGFSEFARRVEAAEVARGGARIEPPEQEVVSENGCYRLRFRPQSWAEQKNVALSLATNLAVADALLKAKTGLFRTMPEPMEWAVRRLHHTAKALGIDWPKKEPLQQLEHRLSPEDHNQAALMIAIRRASPGAAYEPYRAGVTPWHSAMAATYCHATAPLRRLADRFVVETALAIANGQPVPEAALAAFEQLPHVMAKADGLAGQINRAVVDLAEAVALEGREGETFNAVVTDTDQRGARIQICSPPVIARLKDKELLPGTDLKVRLDAADPVNRTVQFSSVG
ncbi:RNB domain-containing ribonuclease [Sphingomonas sp.]|uniref:RNB domain-containing ribonuclease n=1 Tax=Sphingomonas sp. TaxID=28214 RepID=UPI0025EDAC7D|nr:RNB domain-containing ribonuclease [Sphingomonas sp.]